MARVDSIFLLFTQRKNSNVAERSFAAGTIAEVLIYVFYLDFIFELLGDFFVIIRERENQNLYEILVRVGTTFSA